MTKKRNNFTADELYSRRQAKIDKYMEIYERFYDAIFDHRLLKRFDPDILEAIRENTVKEQRAYYVINPKIYPTYGALNKEIDEIIRGIDYIAQDLADALDDPSTVRHVPSNTAVIDGERTAVS